MQFQYEDVQVIFCDEISMVGSMKLTKINYRLQDLVDGRRKQDFMGGISFLASGKLKYIIKINILPHFNLFDLSFNFLDGNVYKCF